MTSSTRSNPSQASLGTRARSGRLRLVLLALVTAVFFLVPVA